MENITAYLNKKRFLNMPLYLFFVLTILYLESNQYIVIAGIIFYIPTIIYNLTHYQQLLSRIKNGEKYYLILVCYSLFLVFMRKSH